MKIKWMLPIIAAILAICLCGCIDSGKTPGNTPADTIPPTSVSPDPSDTPDIEPREYDYEAGQHWKYAYYDGEAEFGTLEYTITSKEAMGDSVLYSIESNLNLKASSSCKPTTFKTEYLFTSLGQPVDSQNPGSPMAYRKSGQIGSG